MRNQGELAQGCRMRLSATCERSPSLWCLDRSTVVVEIGIPGTHRATPVAQVGNLV